MVIIVFRTIADEEVITSWSVGWYFSFFWNATDEICCFRVFETFSTHSEI